MTKTAKIILISVTTLIVIIGCGVYGFYRFLSAFSPPKVKITTDYISTNRDFINGITIEKIEVDSIGIENYPTKYTVVYRTSCHIQHPENKPPNPPDKIYFNKKGKYSWTEESVETQFVHEGLSRHTTDSTYNSPWRPLSESHEVCPIEFQSEQWYFFTIGHPSVTGIFFYIDKLGQGHQYFLPSGISPI